MMKQPTQAESIEREILKLIDEGMDQKVEIFSKVVDNLGVPRPTVRRVAKDLRTKLQKHAMILNQDAAPRS